MNMAAYKRVLLKLSGEALSGDKKTGFDEETCKKVAVQIKEIINNQTEVALLSEEVISGGEERVRILTGQKLTR